MRKLLLLLLLFPTICLAEGMDYTYAPLGFATRTGAKIVYPYKLIVSGPLVYFNYNKPTENVATINISSIGGGGGGSGGGSVSGAVVFAFDGGGSSIATQEQVWTKIPFNFTARGWTLLATPNTASIKVAVFKTTLTNWIGAYTDISANSYPQVNSFYKATNPDVSVKWTATAFNNNDVLTAKVLKVDRTSKAVIIIHGTHPTF